MTAEDLPGPTAAHQRAVLLVVRGLADLSRLLDVLPALRRDRRVGLFWTARAGLPALAGLGAPALPWPRARERRFDLVLAAHPDPALRELDGPLVLLAPADDAFRDGAVARAALADPATVPDHLGVADDHLLDSLRAIRPATADRAFVAGDPVWDRLDGGRRAWRDALRAELGVRPGQRVVAVVSTWDTTSLLGARPSLPERLLAQLPADEYRVVLAAHPHVWDHHGDYQVHNLLADAHDGGLLTALPSADWQSAALLADVAVGDHSSLSVYLCASGVPVLAAGTGTSALPPRSTARLVLESCPGLDVDGDLRAQVDAVLGARPPEPAVAAARARLARRAGQSLHLVRAKLYEVMKLAPDRSPAPPRPAPAFHRAARPCTAHHVVVTEEADHYRAERFPAPLADHRYPLDDRGRVLVAAETEPDPDLRATAEALVSSVEREPREAGVWARDTLADNPGCALAVTPTPSGPLAVPRDGPAWLVDLAGASAEARLPVAAAVLLHRTGARSGPAEASRVRIGPTLATLTARPL